MSALLRSILPFFGVSAAGASPAIIAKGRRRVVTLASFLTFVLLVAALRDEEWVSGGLEYTPGNYSAVQRFQQGCSMCDSGLTATTPMLRVNKIQHVFNLGLDDFTMDSSVTLPYSQIATERTCKFDLTDFIAEVNAAAASTSPGFNLWAGLQPISLSTFSATRGLLGFAAFTAIVTWLAMVGLQYEAGFVASPKTVWVVRGLTINTTFFAIIGLIVFGTSSVKSEFCKAFDPDAQFTGLGCGYGNGYNLNVAALVFALFTVILAWAYMKLDLSLASSTMGVGYEPTGTTSATTAFNSYGSDERASASTVSGYQGIGPSV